MEVVRRQSRKLFTAVTGFTVMMSVAMPQGRAQVDTSMVSGRTQEQRVLIIGSSVAHGWRDTVGGGYLRRALFAFSRRHHMRMEITDRSIPGQGVMSITHKYSQWLNDVRPDIVVVGWGGLDDLHAKTPLNQFRGQVHWEIQMALNRNAKVLVVTPPVSKASYTNYRLPQAILLDNEVDVARDFHNENVQVFDVFNQMKVYLKQHHESYSPYMADGWHPNAAGHALAGRLLTDDMMRSPRI